MLLAHGGDRSILWAAFSAVACITTGRSTAKEALQSLQAFDQQGYFGEGREYFGPKSSSNSSHLAWSNVTYPPVSLDDLTNYGSAVAGDYIYTVGGRCVTDRTTAFDTTTKTWLDSTSLPLLNVPRSDHSVATVGKTLYVAGGITDISSEYRGTGSLLDSLEWFDTSELKGVWKIGQCCLPGCPTSAKTDAATPCMPTARSDFNMEAVGMIIYVLNGNLALGSATNLTRAVEAFDTVTRKWNTKLPPIPGPARTLASSTTAGTKIYVFGGIFFPDGVSSMQNLRTLQAFDTITSTWESLPEVGYDYWCGDKCPIAFFQNSIYVILGHDGNATNKAVGFEGFDLGASKWIAAPEPPSSPADAGEMYTFAEVGAVGNMMFVVNGRYTYQNGTERPLGTIALSCAAGWYGPNCNECPPHRYGPNCVSCQCLHGSCGPPGFNSTGKCTSCNPHWVGANCANCDSAHFGSGCSQACVCGPHGASNSSGVNGTGKCAACKGNWDISGNCVDCVANYFGAACDKKCTCNEGGAADGCSSGIHGNGHCVSCESNWAGVDCTDCAADYFGSNCQTPCSCSVHGKENASGINGNGHCKGCQKHYSGLDCTVCNGQADPDDCLTDYAGKCNDPVIGQKVSLNCPFMCNTCDGGPKSNSKEIIIIAASSGCAVAVLLAVIAYLLFFIRRKRRASPKDSNYSSLTKHVGDGGNINDDGNNSGIYE